MRVTMYTLLSFMDLNHIVSLSSGFVTRLFANELSLQLSFHSAYHTENVVTAAYEIGLHTEISTEELHLLMLAAWFHDTGYTKGYAGHELLSIAIAKNFLIEGGLDVESIGKVSACIMATRFPQQPTNLIEMVLCDADFYHFSRSDYTNFERSLRKEWETCLNLHYTDEQWNLLNFEMLTTHKYFTNYGKTVLQERKQKNIDRLKQLIGCNNQSL